MLSNFPSWNEISPQKFQLCRICLWLQLKHFSRSRRYIKHNRLKLLQLKLTRFVMIWKHFCFILSTGTRIRIDPVMHPPSSSRGRNTSASVTVTGTHNWNWSWEIQYFVKSTARTMSAGVWWRRVRTTVTRPRSCHTD